LRSIGAAAVEPLTKALKDSNGEVRASAAWVLGKIGDARAVEPLVSAMRDWEAGNLAAEALKKLGWKPTTVEERVHYAVAREDRETLEKRWQETKQVLLKDMESGDSVVIENAVYALIGLGKEEVIQPLIEILEKKGTKSIAEAYLNCGRGELRDAARGWASRHGYLVVPFGGSAPVRWGSW